MTPSALHRVRALLSGPDPWPEELPAVGAEPITSTQRERLLRVFEGPPGAGATLPDGGRETRRPMATLYDFVNNGGDWPRDCLGLRVGRGRAVWTTADFPDGSNGHRVRVSRIVREGGETFSRVAFYDRDRPISFVYP